jgi:hypothetical protein
LNAWRHLSGGGARLEPALCDNLALLQQLGAVPQHAQA